MHGLFFHLLAEPETRCTANVAGGEIRVHVVTRTRVRPVCGAVAGRGLPSPVT